MHCGAARTHAFWTFADADRARKHGMEEYISADPCKFDHATLFKMLQTLTLDYRLNDPYCSLVWRRYFVVWLQNGPEASMDPSHSQKKKSIVSIVRLKKK